MKVRLNVDYDAGSVLLESDDHEDLLDLSTVLHVLAVGSDNELVQIPMGARQHMKVGAGQIDRIDFTWER